MLFAQAMVSPLARKPKAATAKRMGAALLSSSPLLLLGSVRLIGTRAADYHEHVTVTCYRTAARNHTQSAFLVQFVLRVWFFVIDFALVHAQCCVVLGCAITLASLCWKRVC